MQTFIRFFFFLLVIFSISNIVQAQNTVRVYAWHDVNGNGIRSGEPNLDPGILLYTANAGGMPVANTLLVGNFTGTYVEFTGVVDGDYVVMFPDNSLFPNYYFTMFNQDGADMQATDGINDSDASPARVFGGYRYSYRITLSGAQTYSNIGVGYFLPASIGDFVFEDFDGDGVQDGIDVELPVAVTITILDVISGLPANDVNGNPIGVTNVPGGVGAYNILNLAPGTYRLTFSLPANWVRTATGQGGPNTDSDPNVVTGETNDIVVVSDQMIDNIDAGYYNPIDIGNRVWEDMNGNGVQDGGEPGVGGVAVNLSGTAGDGSVVNMNVNTNGAGDYNFLNVPPGTNYTINFTLPNATWFFTTQDAGGDDDLDSDPNRVNGNVANIMVMSSDPNITNIDAGMFRGSRVSDFVWEDMNGNGLQDGGEPGVVVTINIYDVATGAIALSTAEPRVPVTAVNSNAAGAYTFTSIWPGEYYLIFDMPGGATWRRTLQNQGGNDAIDSDPDIPTGQTDNFTLVSNDNNQTIDAGYFRIASIADFVWEDMNGNGLQDGEPALDGIPVSLVDDLGAAVNDADGNPVANTASAGGGMYEFNTLRPGGYRVIFGTIPDYFRTIADAAGGPTHPADVANDSDANQLSGQTFIISLRSNDEEEDIDAGLYQAGKIQGVVWEDCNGNGIRDGGEMLLSGWSVSIRTAAGGPVTDVNGNPVANIMTDGSGMYMFGDLPPGEYRIMWVLMGGYQWTMRDYSGGNTDATDVQDDSDSNGGQSHIITITSDREVMGVDAGVFMTIDLTGFAFFDNNQSGVFEAGEVGAGSVLIQLFQVAGGGPCPGGVGGLVAQNVTDGTGMYSFNALPPGSYIVRVDGSNFGGTGTLQGFTPTTALEFCINLDCNFDPDAQDYDFGFFYDCVGNPTWTQWPNCQIASENPVICNLLVLDLFCGSMFTQNSPGPVPSPLCPGGGAPHNMSWFAFVAGQGNYEIVLRPSNCIPGGGGQLGIQAGIYTDCTFSNAVYCQPGCSTGTITLPSSSLIPGEVYYFFLDGCSGSICDYEIDVNGTFSPFILPFPTGVSVDADGCMPICPGKSVRFELMGLDIELDYTWSVVDQNGVQPPLNFPTGWPLTTVNNITLEFLLPGVYTVCMENATNTCENRGPYCVDVTISLIDDEIFDADPSTPELDPFVICGNDFPYNGTSPDMNNNTPTDQNGDGIGWLGGDITYSMANQEITHLVTAPGCNCMYNQIIRVDSLIVNPPQSLTFLLCKDETPMEYDGNPNFITFGFDNPILYKLQQTTQTNGCDSFVLYNAYVFEIIDGIISEIECDPIEMGVLVRFGDNNTQYIDYGLGATWTYTWYDPSNNIIAPSVLGDNYSIFRVTGTYRLVVTMTYNGALGNKICEFEYMHDFDITDYAPDYPELQIVSTLCPGTGLYTHRVLNSDPNLTYTWTWPGTAVYVSGQSSDTLVLNWSASNGGDVTVYANNGCMDGPVSIDNIFIPSSVLAAFNITPEVCVDNEATITVTSTNSALSNYIWDWGGGTPAGGSGVGRGPHQVSWNSPGIKTVTLMVEVGGCFSTLFSQTITVIEPMDPPSLSCSASENEVIFDWVPPAGVTGYIFDILPAVYTGTQNGNMYTISGIPVNTDIQLTVTFVMSGPCGNIVSVGDCRTQNCTPPTVTLTTPQDSVCLPEQSGIITLMASTSATGGTAVFSGMGITDPNLPLFDPVAAGPGTHIISYRHTDDNGCVSNPAARVTIRVFNTPSALFEAVPDNICITGQVNVTYLGSDGMGLGTLNYNFDGGTATGPGVGPFPVRYMTTGVKTISLYVERNGCVSPTLTETVTIDGQLDNVVVTCIAQGLDFVEFQWNNDPKASGYSIVIDAGAPVMQTGNTFRVNGLMENQTVSIVVTAISPNACPDKVSTLVNCTAKACPPVVIDMEAVADICLRPGAAIVPLVATVDAASANQTLFMWSGPGIVAGTNNFDPQLAGVGTHNVTITYSENGCSETGIGTIKVNPRPVASFTGDNRICVTDQYVATYTGSMGGSVTLAWTPAPTNSIANMHNFSFATPGTFNISLVVDSLGCDSPPFQEMVTVEPELSVPAADSIKCLEYLDKIEFDWGTINCASSYRVFVNNVLINTINTTNYDALGLLEGEKVSLRVEFISDCECGDIAITKECEARNCPPVQLSLTPGQSEICLEDVTGIIPVNLTISGNDNTGVGTWSGSPFVNNQGQFDAIGAGVGTHTIRYTYIQENCTFDDVTTIIINPTPSMIVGTPIQPICFDDNMGSIDISGSGGTGTLQYLLDNQSVAAGSLNVGSGSHSLQVIDAKGCKTPVSNFTISIPREPVIEITGPTLFNTGDTINYTIPDTEFSGFNVDSVIWTINGVRVNCSLTDCYKLVQYPQNVGQFEYVVTVYYNGSCQVDARLKVTAQSIIITEVPNIIIPKRNGNNLFFVKSNDPTLIVQYMKIYDRWGNLIFHIDEPYSVRDNLDKGWDGTFKDNPVIPGVYVYIIETVSTIKSAIPKSEFLTGDITVIR
ncbi:MAG: SdrD B-like domain-containing protein [Saprospiraceae bacterium]